MDTGQQNNRAGNGNAPSPTRAVEASVHLVGQQPVSALTLRDYKTRMLRVLVHIQQHLDDPLGLEQLAAIACFSPHHFHRVFTGMLGEPVKEHIRRLRLERAASHLKLGNRPVVQIALEAGYETHEAFSRAFKIAFGMAPVKFRLLRRARGACVKPAKHRRHAVHYAEGNKPGNFRTMKPPHNSPEIAIKNLPDLRVAFIRHVGPYAECGQAWDKLCTHLGKEGMLGGQCQFIGMSHDDPEVTPPERIRYDACVTVDGTFQAEGDIGIQTIPGGDYAVTTHFGPYQRLNKTYARMMGQWLPRSGRELGNSSCFEIYLNDPNSTDPEDLITDVYVPLKPLGSCVGSLQH